VVIAPLTTSPKAYPTRVPVVLQNKKGFIAVDQIRTLDKKRILEILPPISPHTIKKLKSVIQETFVA
jgi:mRNA interferase MazF